MHMMTYEKQLPRHGITHDIGLEISYKFNDALALTFGVPRFIVCQTEEVIDMKTKHVFPSGALHLIVD